MADTEIPEGNSASTSRMACSFCKKRKLKCNRQLPKCASCTKFRFECEYGPLRSQSKRELKMHSSPSHVKRLEDRLGRVEQLLQQATSQQQRDQDDMVVPDIELSTLDHSMWEIQPYSFEPLVIQEIEQLYFIYIHPSVNIIHHSRYLLSTLLAPSQRTPLFLRHALCALAAPTSSVHAHLKEDFYHSSRHHLQEAELKDTNFNTVTLAHAQTWILIAVYELRECFMHRALMSISRAVRLVQLMRLHILDGVSRHRDPSLNLLMAPDDWTQAEERRRLFWFTFLMDRYTAISMGWPTLIDQGDIRTLLPASDDAYENSTEEPSVSIKEAIRSSEKHHLLSSFAAQIINVEICSSRLKELSRMEASTEPDDWTGNMWSTSTRIESMVEANLRVPPHLQIPPGKLNPSSVFLGMGQSSGIIVVHRVARHAAATNPLSTESMEKSETRCMEAASTILQLLKMTTHWDVHIFHPCTTFCLYMAAMVFAEFWQRDTNPESESALRLLVDSLQGFKKVTRLSYNLLQDIEEELPGLLAKLAGENSTPLEVYNELIDIDIDLLDQITTDVNRVDDDMRDSSNAITSSAYGCSGPDNGTRVGAEIYGDVSSWTVDDPDIASVGRYI